MQNVVPVSYTHLLQGEYTPSMIKKAVLGTDAPEFDVIDEPTPVRPPVMCAGCPHRGTFYVLKKLGLVVSGDIGCYTPVSYTHLYYYFNMRYCCFVCECKAFDEIYFRSD